MTEFLTQEEFKRNQDLLERVRPLLRRLESCSKARGSFRMTRGLTDDSYEIKVCGRVFCGSLEEALEVAVHYAESL